MQTIYGVEGILNRGFVGQVSYNVCLDKKFEAIDIEFSFDKQRVSTINEDIRNDIRNDFIKENTKEPSEEEIIDRTHGMKTEIQIEAFLNDKFIGGIHRQMDKRNLYISSKEATEGAITQKNIEGVIKVNIIVFNVIYDNTHYELNLKGL